MKYLQNEARKQKSIKEVTLQFSMIFRIRLKNNTVNFRVICPLSSDVFDNTNGMSNVKRLDQKCWLVDNVKFASGQRSCCQKRRLLKLDRSTLFRHTNLIQIMLISIRGVLANCYNFKTNLRNCLQHERPCCIEYIITSRRRVIIYSIQHGRECCKQLVK